MALFLPSLQTHLAKRLLFFCQSIFQSKTPHFSCFYKPTPNPLDHEEEIEELQIFNHAINASNQFDNNLIINVRNMVNNSTINPEKDFISNQVIDSTQESVGNQVNDYTTQKSVGNQVIGHLPCKDILLNNDSAINMDEISDIYSNDQIDQNYEGLGDFGNVSNKNLLDCREATLHQEIQHVLDGYF